MSTLSRKKRQKKKKNAICFNKVLVFTSDSLPDISLCLGGKALGTQLHRKTHKMPLAWLYSLLVSQNKWPTEKSTN